LIVSESPIAPARSSSGPRSASLAAHQRPPRSRRSWVPPIEVVASLGSDDNPVCGRHERRRQAWPVLIVDPGSRGDTAGHSNQCLPRSGCKLVPPLLDKKRRAARRRTCRDHEAERCARSTHRKGNDHFCIACLL
jgi:hypothetical protein